MFVQFINILEFFSAPAEPMDNSTSDDQDNSTANNVSLSNQLSRCFVCAKWADGALFEYPTIFGWWKDVTRYTVAPQSSRRLCHYTSFASVSEAFKSLFQLRDSWTRECERQPQPQSERVEEPPTSPLSSSSTLLSDESSESKIAFIVCDLLKQYHAQAPNLMSN